VPISRVNPLEVAGLSAGYGKIVVLRDVALTVGRGRGGGAARTQRRRQDDAPARGLGPATGARPRAFRRRDMAGAGPGDTVRAGLVHVVEGAPRLHPAQRRRQPPAGGYGLPKAELTRQVEEALAFFPDRRQAQRSRGDLVGRPAADARRCPRPGAPSAFVDAGRTFSRTVARCCRSCSLAAMARLREAGTAILLVRAADRESIGRGRPGLCAGRAARSCSKPGPTRPICPTGWSMPISVRM